MRSHKMCNTITISSASPFFFFSLSYSVINSYLGLWMLIMHVDRRGQESNRWPSGWRTTAQPASPVYTHTSPTHHPCFAGSVISICVCVCVCAMLLSPVYFIAQWEHVISVCFLQLVLNYPVVNSGSHREFNDTQEEERSQPYASVFTQLG